MTKISFNKTEVKIFALFFFLYLILTHWVGSNEESTFDLLRSLAEKNKINIDDFYNNTVDRQYYNNHYYATKPPGLPLLGMISFIVTKLQYSLFAMKFNFDYYFFLTSLSTTVNKASVVISTPDSPLILYSKFLLTVSTSCLFAALTMVLLYKILKYFTKKEAIRKIAIISYGFGTLALAYSPTFYVHAAGIFLIFSAFFILFKTKVKKQVNWKNFSLSGLFAGFAIITDYTTVSIFFPLIIYSFLICKSKKYLLYLFIGILIGVSPLLIYNYSIFGNVFDSILRYPDPQIWSSSPSITESTNLGLHLGLDPFIILRLLIYPDFGLFYYNPILLFSIVGLFFMLKTYKEEFIFIALSFILIIYLNSIFWGWWAGGSFGPRYLVSIIPFMILPIAYKLTIKNSIVFLILLIVSIFINSLSLNNWQNNAQNPNTLDLVPDIKNQIDSLKVIYNPLGDYYFKTFLKNGVRNHVINDIVTGKFIDIKDTDQDIKPMSNNSTLVVYSSHKAFVRVQFDALSINKSRVLEISSQINTPIFINIKANVFQTYNTTPLEINSGRNEIEFINTEKCNLTNETLGLNDVRCLSFEFKNIKIQEIQ